MSPIDESTPIHLQVSFNPPEPVEIKLQGPALRAYYQWLKTPSRENEEILGNAIYSQCENYVVTWSTLDEWDYA